jgi:uncharacterized membrane protein
MRTFALLLATITTGLMSGVYAAYAFSVMPGLRGADDRTFVDVMQRFNVAILNGWFLLCFLGGLVFGVLALVLGWGTPARLWIALGVGLYVLSLLITFVVNVPLNNALMAASVDVPGAARAAFEARWVIWNLVRALASTAGFALLAWSLRLL